MHFQLLCLAVTATVSKKEIGILHACTWGRARDRAPSPHPHREQHHAQPCSHLIARARGEALCVCMCVTLTPLRHTLSHTFVCTPAQFDAGNKFRKTLSPRSPCKNALGLHGEYKTHPVFFLLFSIMALAHPGIVHGTLALGLPHLCKQQSSHTFVSILKTPLTTSIESPGDCSESYQFKGDCARAKRSRPHVHEQQRVHCSSNVIGALPAPQHLSVTYCSWPTTKASKSTRRTNT
jgi:hypothetical protein